MNRRGTRLAHGLTLMLALSACAQQKTMTLPAAGAELFNPSIPVEIVGDHAISDRHGYVVAGAGEGIGVGMLAGAGAAIGGGAQTGDPYGFLLGVVLAPVFAVGGGVYGAAAAHSSDETERSVAAIEAVYDDPGLLGSIDEEVAKAFKVSQFAVRQDCDQLVRAGEADAVDKTGVQAGCATDQPRSRLRLEESFAFATRGAYSPDLVFVINVDAVASDPTLTSEAQEFRWVYISPEMDFFEATASDAAALRQSIATAQGRIARRIVEDLHTARHETQVVGTYWPDRPGVNFFPAAITPGAVIRAPTKSQLINVAENELR